MKKTHLIFTVLATAFFLGSLQTKAAAQEAQEVAQLIAEAQEEAELRDILQTRLDQFYSAPSLSKKKKAEIMKSFHIAHKLLSLGNSPYEREQFFKIYSQLSHRSKVVLNYLIIRTPLHFKLEQIIQTKKRSKKAQKSAQWQIELGDAQKIRVQEAARMREATWGQSAGKEDDENADLYAF